MNNHNQCDGCKRGLRIVKGIHWEDCNILRRSYPYMACTKGDYIGWLYTIKPVEK
jgi:hypothetical protein